MILFHKMYTFLSPCLVQFLTDEDQKKELMEKMRKTRQKRQQQTLPQTSQTPEHSSPSVSTTVVGYQTPFSEIEVDRNETGSTKQVSGAQISAECSVPTMSSSTAEIAGILWTQETSVCTDPTSRSVNFPHIHGSSQSQTSESDSQQSLCEEMVRYENESAVENEQAQVLNIAQPPLSSEPIIVEQTKPPSVEVQMLTQDKLPSDPQMYRRLSEDERMLLALLSAMYEDTVLASLRDSRSSTVLDSSNYNICDFLADCDVQVRLAVNFVNRLEDFQKLDLDDRIACFKVSISVVMAVRNAYIFVSERNSWLMMKGEMSYELCKILFPTHSHLDWGTEKCRELKQIARNDINIYALLHCILLFDPSDEKISNRQLVSSMRDKYVVLLRHYLEATFSFKYSEDYFRELQNMMVDTRYLCQASKKMSKGMESKAVEVFAPYKLLKELHTHDAP